MKNITTLFLILALCSSAYSKKNLKASSKGNCSDGEWTLCAKSDDTCHWEGTNKMKTRCGSGSNFTIKQTEANDSKCSCGAGTFCWYAKPTFVEKANNTWMRDNTITDQRTPFLVSENRQYGAFFSGYGELSIKDVSMKVMWKTQSRLLKADNGRLVFQGYDGNIVIYDSGTTAYWNTKTQNTSDTKAMLSNEGHFEVYAKDTIVWTSATSEGFVLQKN